MEQEFNVLDNFFAAYKLHNMGEVSEYVYCCQMENVADSVMESSNLNM